MRASLRFWVSVDLVLLLLIVPFCWAGKVNRRSCNRGQTKKENLSQTKTMIRAVLYTNIFVGALVRPTGLAATKTYKL